MMKKYLLLVLATWAASSAAATPANFYECRGINVSASYVTQSLTGTVLTITVDGTTYQARNDEIRDETTVLGNLLTLITEAIPDAYTDTLTLLLPDVNVSGFGAKTAFVTRLFKTRTHTSIGGPQLVDGVIQSNSSVALKCTATAVVF
jgi:hypothetical protein